MSEAHTPDSHLDCRPRRHRLRQGGQDAGRGTRAAGPAGGDDRGIGRHVRRDLHQHRVRPHQVPDLPIGDARRRAGGRGCLSARGGRRARPGCDAACRELRHARRHRLGHRAHRTGPVRGLPHPERRGRRRRHRYLHGRARRDRHRCAAGHPGHSGASRQRGAGDEHRAAGHAGAAARASSFSAVATSASSSPACTPPTALG